jgi:hypothetical protein
VVETTNNPLHWTDQSSAVVLGVRRLPVLERHACWRMRCLLWDWEEGRTSASSDAGQRQKLIEAMRVRGWERRYFYGTNWIADLGRDWRHQGGLTICLQSDHRRL